MPRELAQLVRRRGPRAGARERADVHLIHDLPFTRHALPAAIGPAERRRIDDLGRAVRSLRLKSRRRIRIQPLVVVQLELIAIAGRRGDRAAEVAAVFARERRARARLRHNVDSTGAGSPHADVRGAGIDSEPSAPIGNAARRAAETLSRASCDPTQVHEQCRGRLPQPRTCSVSRMLRTFRAKTSGVNGFCRNAAPGARSSCIRM